jgi:hypothetical protein
VKVLVVEGARLNFMKVAPVLAELNRRGNGPVLVHTAQHYDASMPQAFFDDVAIRAPDHFLGVGAGSHAAMTARVTERFEPVLLDERPDWVLVPGDVNSTLAAALITVKLCEQTGARLAHLEAGCAVTTGAWPKRSTASSPTVAPTCCSRPATTPGRTWCGRGSPLDVPAIVVVDDDPSKHSSQRSVSVRPPATISYWNLDAVVITTFRHAGEMRERVSAFVRSTHGVVEL